MKKGDKLKKDRRDPRWTYQGSAGAFQGAVDLWNKQSEIHSDIADTYPENSRKKRHHLAKAEKYAKAARKSAADRQNAIKKMNPLDGGHK